METKAQKIARLKTALKDGAVPDIIIPGLNPEVELFDYQKTGVSWLYLTPRALLADQTGSGKSLVNSTRVLTPTGWVNISDLEVGDKVIGTEGVSHYVTGVFPQGEKEVLEAHFSDGCVVECCEEHLWTLEEQHSYFQETKPLSYFEASLETSSEESEAVTWRLPDQKVCQFAPSGRLAIDPYALGQLLGEESPYVVTAARTKAAETAVASVAAGTHSQHGRWASSSYDRSIPNEYLFSSIDDRLALLQGLMDESGVPVQSGVVFRTSSSELAEGVAHLVRSLGGSCCISNDTSTTYHLDIALDMPLFRLDAKLGKLSPYNPSTRHLTRVVRTGRMEHMTCISVDAPDKLFLVDGFVPTHNTLHGLSLLQYLKSKGKLSVENRAVIICPAKSVLGSWKADGIDFFFPEMKYAVARQATKAKRMAVYDDPTWEVLVTNYELVLRDIDKLVDLGIKYVLLDEVHEVRNHETKTAIAVKRLTIPANRVIGMTATPIQNHLGDLHGIMEVLGLGYVFGTKAQFERRHHDYKLVKVFYNGRSHDTKKLIGYKNTKLLKQMIEPFYLRRTYDDIDADVPDLLHRERWFELTPKQKKLYDNIKDGLVSKIDENTDLNALRNVALRLRQLCTTTATLTGEDHSSKLDWLMQTLQGDWQNEKVIIFSNWKSSLKATTDRLNAAGIGHVIITSDDNKQEVREERRQIFWNDPNCRVLLGTTAIETSLNLQCAKVQVNLDMLWNPARHDQLAGRHRRVGSVHDSVFVFSLLTTGTIEEAMMHVLKRKQALADHIFDDQSKLFASLSKEELLRMIRS